MSPDNTREDLSRHIGRVYEAYIGHQYETDSFKVLYTGFMFGKQDHGIDVIAVLADTIHLIQCKNTASPVPASTIRQLYGIKTELMIRYAGKYKFEAEIYASHLFSPPAIESAQTLNITATVQECKWYYYDENASKYQSSDRNFYDVVDDWLKNNVVIVPSKLSFSDKNIANSLCLISHEITSIKNNLECISADRYKLQYELKQKTESLNKQQAEITALNKKATAIDNAITKLNKHIDDRFDVLEARSSVRKKSFRFFEHKRTLLSILAFFIILLLCCLPFFKQ